MTGFCLVAVLGPAAAPAVNSAGSIWVYIDSGFDWSRRVRRGARRGKGTRMDGNGNGADGAATGVAVAVAAAAAVGAGADAAGNQSPLRGPIAGGR